jgi:hypothetical protein
MKVNGSTRKGDTRFNVENPTNAEVVSKNFNISKVGLQRRATAYKKIVIKGKPNRVYNVYRGGGGGGGPPARPPPQPPSGDAGSNHMGHLCLRFASSPGLRRWASATLRHRSAFFVQLNLESNSTI